ncbi:O-antigen ligase family protein [Maritalea porphyrae]|uniref:O-antigen ligase family protein n=1 Tax=Maritalea porphyrae TaxID=880732 RepID=UPI0022AFB858|nr:O-antigen ligase family protein [Maritalea porphyrae]MCZ4270817.1 O-antigen ligase family protein [Maritalea porphyrae]
MSIQTTFVGENIKVSGSALAHRLMMMLVPVWIAGGALVMFEPSPYELVFVAVFACAMLAGMPISRRTNTYLMATLLFIPPAFVAILQMQYSTLSKGLIFTTVTVFLLITGYFVANFVAEKPFERMRLINKAYIFAAVFAALIGTLAYLGLIPGKDLFLRYGRAKAFFKDPNVFGPFLVLPAAYLWQRILLGDYRKMAMNALWLGIICVGVFVSFSRGAWGHLLLTFIIVYLLNFLLEATPRERIKMIGLAVVGIFALVLGILGLLMIPQVADLFLQRASLVQSYDGGETGRFGRQAWGYALALNNPLGIGPWQFDQMLVLEQPHNTYLKVFLDYGWLGGGAFVWLILMTLRRAVVSMAIPSPNRLLMIPAFATFLPLILEAAIIDIDHWRHLFLVMGIIWGVSAGYDVYKGGQYDRRLP